MCRLPTLTPTGRRARYRASHLRFPTDFDVLNSLTAMAEQQIQRPARTSLEEGAGKKQRVSAHFKPPTAGVRPVPLALPLILFAATCVSTYFTGGWAFCLALMVLLLLLIGPNHRPTANDEMELGFGRTVLGYSSFCSSCWASLRRRS
jgi:hypothetical protein